MGEYVKANGVPLDVIDKATAWLTKERFDSDAIKEDVKEDDISSKQCGLLQHIAHSAMCNSIVKFLQKTQGMNHLKVYNRII